MCLSWPDPGEPYICTVLSSYILCGENTCTADVHLFMQTKCAQCHTVVSLVRFKVL